MPGNLINALAFIIDAISGLLLMILLLRLILPLMRADFHNPIAQAILKLTSPLIIPVRRVIPAVGKLDTATLLVAFVIQCVTSWLILTLYGASASLYVVAFNAVIKLIVLTINIFLFSILISIILSWVAPGQHNPISAFVRSLAEPVLRPFRQVIPAIGGLDISPVFAMIGLSALSILVKGISP